MRRMKLSLLVGALFVASGANAGTPDGLFFPVVGAGPAGGDAVRPVGVRQRLVRVDGTQLDHARRLVQRRRAAPALFNLLDDAVFHVVFERTASTASGYSLAGRIADVPSGRVVLVVNGDVLAGRVWTPQASYRIRSRGADLHIVEKVDPASALPLAEPRIPSLGGRAQTRRKTQSAVQAQDGAAQIDLLVFWTPAARQAVFGLRPVQARVDLMVAIANEAYVNGGVAQRVRLVGATEVNYEEAMVSDIDRLVDPTDDFLSEVHEIRDSYAADLVSGIVRFRDGLGGVAQLMTEPTQDFAPSAFSLVGVHALDTTLAHELGHNMGLNHDRYVVHAQRDELIRVGLLSPDDKIAVFPYSYGYVNQRAFGGDSPCWRTIMAYPAQCFDAGLIPIDLPRFSNPEQNHPSPDGDPLGVPLDTPVTESQGPAHSVQSLNEVRHVVASFRDGANRCTFTLSPGEVDVPAAGGTFDIRIETGDGCSWRAHHQSDFISPHSNDANAGSGEVTYAAQPNGGLARAGVASIAGETFAVRQAGEEALIPVCQRTREVRDAIVMELTGKACEALTEQDLQHVSSLSFRGRRLTSLRPDDFQGLVNLSRLDLSGAITDIAPLAGLVGFTQLKELHLADNGVRNLSPLANLTQIEILDLNHNAIADLAPLAGLRKLRIFSARDNEIEDLAPLASLTSLEHLDLTDNAISDLSPLAGLNLLSLLLGNNKIKDISALADVGRLRNLELRGNAITDISPLLGLMGLFALDLRDNALNEVAFDTHIPALQAKGVRVIFDEPAALSQPRPWLWQWLLRNDERRD